MACALLSSFGCLSQSYEITAGELERIAALPIDERRDRVRVTQQTSLGNDASAVESADWWSDDDLAFIIAGNPDGQHHRRWRGHRHDSDSEDDAAADALATAVVVVAAAATAAVTVGITEGARFDGWLAVPVEHPLLLVDDSGRRRWTRLEALTLDDLHGINRAVLPDLAGDLQRLNRHPLAREGFVYQLEFGAEPAPFEGPTLAVSGRGGVGFMPAQHFGFLIGAAFSTARGDESPSAGRESSTLSFDHRVFLQTEAWPFWAGRWHLGPYVELGYAWALVDDTLGSRAVAGPMLALGAALQLDWTTRLALTLRAGAAWVPSIDSADALAPDRYRLAPALTLGVSIY
jgi:hypothetical protein